MRSNRHDRLWLRLPRFADLYGRETYFMLNDQICRRYPRHPGVMVKRNGLWAWL